MEILTSVRRLHIRFKSLVNDFVYSFGRAGRSVEPTVPVRERRRKRLKQNELRSKAQRAFSTNSLSKCLTVS